MILLSKAEEDFLVIRPNAPVAHIYQSTLPRGVKVYWVIHAPRTLKRLDPLLLMLGPYQINGGRIIELIRTFNEIELEQS